MKISLKSFLRSGNKEDVDVFSSLRTYFTLGGKKSNKVLMLEKAIGTRLPQVPSSSGSSFEERYNCEHRSIVFSFMHSHRVHAFIYKWVVQNAFVFTGYIRDRTDGIRCTSRVLRRWKNLKFISRRCCHRKASKFHYNSAHGRLNVRHRKM